MVRGVVDVSHIAHRGGDEWSIEGADLDSTAVVQLNPTQGIVAAPVEDRTSVNGR
jgi:hypothetical protein